MSSKASRRKFLQTAGIGALAGTALAGQVNASATGAVQSTSIKIVGIACSPRKGKTTAAALQIVLDAAKAVAPDRIVTELIE